MHAHLEQHIVYVLIQFLMLPIMQRNRATVGVSWVISCQLTQTDEHLLARANVKVRLSLNETSRDQENMFYLPGVPFTERKQKVQNVRIKLILSSALVSLKQQFCLTNFCLQEPTVYLITKSCASSSALYIKILISGLYGPTQWFHKLQHTSEFKIKFQRWYC